VEKAGKFKMDEPLKIGVHPLLFAYPFKFI
jgi:hypothetical protein